MKPLQILLATAIISASISLAQSQTQGMSISPEEAAIRMAQKAQMAIPAEGESKKKRSPQTVIEQSLRNEEEVQLLQDELAQQNTQYNQFSEVVNSFCTVSAVSFHWWNLQIVTYSTLPTKPCNVKEYIKVSVASVKEQLRGATNSPISVVKGGTHFRTMDVARTGLAEPYIYIGNVKMRPESRLRITILDFLRHPSLFSVRGGYGGEYQKMRAQEASYFRWDPGSTIYYLEGPAPEKETFIMTAFTSQLLPTLNRGNLSELGATLALPEGWHFRTKVITQVVEYKSGGLAYDSIRMIDEYGNYYVQIQSQYLK